MNAHTRHLSAASLVIAAILFCSPALARYTISCQSQNYRYQYCSANTDGYARLANQSSRSPCVQGRTWGYDNGGVWVNNGCGGSFEVGGSSRSRSDAGAAIAAGVGLAILGAIIANNDRDDDGPYYPPQPYPSYPPGPPPYPPGPPSYPDYSGSVVPGWAIGSFSGTDSAGRPQSVRINPDGAVTLRSRGRTDRGSMSGGTINIAGTQREAQPFAGGIAIDGMSYFRN